MDQEMIERVNKAVFAHIEQQVGTIICNVDVASVAIKAMREPTRNMIEQADAGWSLEYGSSAHGCWQDMIDAIIGD